MKQKTKTQVAKSIPAVKETAGSSTARLKRSQRATANKEKELLEEKIEIPVSNGMKQNGKKRKAGAVAENTEVKKQKTSDEDAEPEPTTQSSDEEVDAEKEQTAAAKVTKVKEMAKAKKGKKPEAPKVAETKALTAAKTKAPTAAKTKAPTAAKTKAPTAERTKAPTAASSKVAAKRQRVLLEVPKLPTLSGVLFVMGYNGTGQLGLLSVAGKKRPAENNVDARFVDIAAGGMHSVCLTSKGEVYTFGCNDEGALGRQTSDDDEAEQTPTMIDLPDVIVKVSAGDCHSAALTASGKVYIWGTFRDNKGIIGLTPEVLKSSSPLQILHNITVVDIASGSEHFACLSNEGDVYTCGCGEMGQLGRMSERSSKGNGRNGLVDLLEPKVVPLRQGGRPVIVSNIWTGADYTFLKSKTSGTIFGFGLNNYYQLGLPLKLAANDEVEEGCAQFKPEKIAQFSPDVDWQCIVGGQHHTLALDDNGQIHVLGRKEYGRLGLGENCEHAGVPTVIPTLADQKCVHISCGDQVSFSIADDGSVYSWGFGTNHQLGHGNDDDQHVPKLIEGNFRNSWIAFKISGGGQHTLLLANRKGTTEEKSEEKK